MTTAARGRVDRRWWARRVLGWDGFWPVIMGASPALLGAVFAGNRGVIEVAGVALPIAAFLFRAHSGGRAIRENHCGPILRDFQVIIFYLGLVPMILCDTMMLLMPMAPGGALDMLAEDLKWLVCFFLPYLMFMTFAMYPGRSQVDDEAEAWSSSAGPPLDPGDWGRA